MTQIVVYDPDDAAVDVSGDIRLASESGFTEMAELGGVGSSSVEVDDEPGTLNIVGLKTVTVDDDASGDSRILTGRFTERRYKRADSLVTGASRRIYGNLLDLNALLGFLLIRPDKKDGKRPKETADARLTWLLASDYLSTLVVDNGFVTYPSTVLDPADYRNQFPQDVLASIATQCHMEFWVYPNAGDNVPSLWFGDDVTSPDWPSIMRLSNVADDVDDFTTFAVEPGAELTRSPSRVFAGASMPYGGAKPGSIYRTRPATADTFQWRDGVAPDSNVKTAARATAVLDQYLEDNATEDDLIICRVPNMPAERVNLARAGQWIYGRFSHFAPEGYGDFSKFRIKRRSVAQAQKTSAIYQVEYALKPASIITGSIVQSSFQYGYAGGIQPLALPNSITPGNLLVYMADKWKGNGVNPGTPNTSPGFGACLGGTGSWGTGTFAKTAASGDRSHLGLWTKFATTSQRSGPVFSSDTWAAIYEVELFTDVGATILTADVPGASSTLDCGSFATPAVGTLAMMVLAQYTPDVGVMGFTPSSPWQTDASHPWATFSSQRPYWQGHAVADGSALEAEVVSTISYPWAGIAILLEPV